MIKSIVLSIIFLKMFCVAAPFPAAAMEFQHIRLKDGTPVIQGQGYITKGDDARLRAAAPLAETDSNGHRILLLDSLGGDVAAAFATARVIEEFEFETVVSWGDMCLSACASILYLSADAHRVVGDGMLGFHSCHLTSKSAAMVDASWCNTEIAAFMEERGYPTELMQVMLSGATLRTITVDGETVRFAIPRPEIHCFGLQQFSWLEQFDPDVRPCIQMLSGGGVWAARDWDHPKARREVLPDAVPVGLYSGIWSPPGGWSYAIIYDAVSLGFRRWNAFPGGPEVEIFCALQAPGKLMVILRRMMDSATPARGLGFRTREAVTVASVTTRTTPDGGFVGVPFNYLMETYVFDTELAELINGPDGPAEFVLFNNAAEPFERIEVDLAGLRARLPNALKNCAGRFPSGR